MGQLKMGVRSEPPTVEVRSIPEIICHLNEETEIIRDNIEHNIGLGLPQVMPYETQENKIVGLILGGSTLDDTFQDALDKNKKGMPIITVNGSYKYCMDRGLTPSAMIMLDSREFNSRFVIPAAESCKYFISSQCHPSVFEKLKDNQVWIWHVAGDENYDLLDNKYGVEYYPIMGGSTVALRALHLLRLLGFPKFEIYGFDSCIIGEHHAYEQPENDGEQEIDVLVAEKEFRCTAAHYHQAKEFVEMIGKTGQHYDMIVHGEGLIAHIIKNPDSLKKKEEVT